jgi:hypothetical protein
MGQKSLHFLSPHFLRMTNAMKTDEAFNPFDVYLLCSRAVAVCAEDGPDPIEQFWRFLGAAHLAAFLAGLPSRGQEIDGKLQSNSR